MRTKRVGGLVASVFTAATRVAWIRAGVATSCLFHGEIAPDG